MLTVYEVKDFESEVIQRSHSVPVLVDFWAEWCGPCKVLGPILERLAKQSNGAWVLAKVDTDRNQELAAKYGIRGIPNVKLFVDGNVADEFTGALPEHVVALWLKKALPDKFRKEIERADALIRENNINEGRKILEDVLDQKPENEHARVLLAGTYLYSDWKKAMELIQSVEEHSEFFPTADAIRTIATLIERSDNPGNFPDDPVKPTYLEAIRELQRNNFDTALKKFIVVIRENRYYDEDGSRKACIAIFRMLGEEHETTRKYRREFGGALNV